jgi:hypothetical protein
MKLVKTVTMTTLVLGLLLFGVLPAQADSDASSPQPSLPLQPEWGKGRWHWGKVEIIRGEVTLKGRDKGGDWVEVSEEKIYVEEGTRYGVPTLGNGGGLDDIEVGMKVVVQAYEEDGKLYARHILVIPGRLQFRHHTGEVTEYIEGESITIESRNGETYTFVIEDELKILPKAASLEVGDWVTVISRRDPTTEELTATGVVVHPERPRERHTWRERLQLRLEGLEQVSGIITTGDGVITVDSTELTYDSSTIFVLRGVTGVDGENGTVFYEDDLAKIVLVGIGPSEIPDIEED